MAFTLDTLAVELSELLKTSLVFTPQTVVVPDHLGYCCDSATSYESKKEYLAGLATLIREISLGGRRISVFELREPINGFGKIELAEPKEGERQADYLEHVAYVSDRLPQLWNKIRSISVAEVLPVKEYSGTKYFKVLFGGHEIEFRERSI